MVYEMLYGKLPFLSDVSPDFDEDFRVSAEAIDLIKRLLEREPTDRLSTVKDILNHKWFVTLDTTKLVEKRIKAP